MYAQKGHCVFTAHSGTISPVANGADMTAEAVLADKCRTTPDNFNLNDSWNDKMGVLEAWCDYPGITKSTVNGKRKPQAFMFTTADDSHDAYAIGIINGTGISSSQLGIAPRTEISHWSDCTDNSFVSSSAKPGDVVFPLRIREDCTYADPALPTIPVIGKPNGAEYVGDTRASTRILISYGTTYGRAVDYFTPGKARISWALPEFAGIIIALNTALIEKGRAPLTMANIKKVLDASSDEVYLRVNGGGVIKKEHEVDALLQNPNNRYYGQLVNLSSAIEYALSQNSGGGNPPSGGGGNPPSGGGSPSAGNGSLPAIFTLLLLSDDLS